MTDMFGFDIFTSSLAVSAIISLIAGILSFLSPCVLPIVPPYIAYMSGISMNRLSAGKYRKIETLFEPLFSMKKDPQITGLSKGVAFLMIESLGIIPRVDISEELKELDQEARGLLRKHGVRFGQYSVFLPILLKPAVTRLRLVLWSIKKNFQEFPSPPEPGLVTVGVKKTELAGYFTKVGYYCSGDWALRIDMLERLADLLRKEDSKIGFEATSDMLSITGMSHEQFASLMSGLGYHVTNGERQKIHTPRVSWEEHHAPPAPVSSRNLAHSLN